MTTITLDRAPSPVRQPLDLARPTLIIPCIANTIDGGSVVLLDDACGTCTAEYESWAEQDPADDSCWQCERPSIDPSTDPCIANTREGRAVLLDGACATCAVVHESWAEQDPADHVQRWQCVKQHRPLAASPYSARAV